MAVYVELLQLTEAFKREEEQPAVDNGNKEVCSKSQELLGAIKTRL